MSDGTVNIKGKNYKLVAARVEEFNTDERFSGWGIATSLLHWDSERVIVKASILDSSGANVGSGIAEELREASNINRTSAMENCETSAIGRALASIGLGGGDSYGSANEVAAAIEQQELKQFQSDQVAHMDAVRDHMRSIYVIQVALFKWQDTSDAAELHTAAEAWTEIDNESRTALWRAVTKGGIFTTKERELMRSNEFVKACREVTQ